MTDSSPAKRNPVSCTECQRRKQRCSRTWPCDRCVLRKISHQCHFKTKAREQIESSLSASAKDTFTQLPTDPFSAGARFDDDNLINTNDAITAWGYMPDPEHFNLRSFGTIVPPAALISSARAPQDRLEEEIEKAVAVIPARTLADILIQNFVHSVNYFHYAIYPPQFLADYTDWWDKRVNRLPLSSTFTCLLIKVCACSVQYLEGESRLQIEYELGENINVLATRYHDAAGTLSRIISPGKGGLTQVQQLFLSVPWYKAESKFIEAWHSLAAAIREAQEIGLHKDSFAVNCSEFDVEMRRRVWCVLYVWDWYLSRWLSRPLLIDQGSCSVTVPRVNLERSDQSPGPPSPFTPVILQYQLAVQLSGESNKPIYDQTSAAATLKRIEAWTESFPEVYQLSDPDTSWDAKYTYLPFQRKHLQLMSNLFKLDPIKHFLTKDPRKGFTRLESDLRAAAVDVSICIIKTSHELFKLMSSPAARGFIVICIAFIATTLLISALMHDTEQVLPYRELILESVHLTMDMTHQLNGVTAAGTIANNILGGLVRSLPLYPDEIALVRFGSCTAQQTQSSLPNTSPVGRLMSDHAPLEPSTEGAIGQSQQSDSLSSTNSDYALLDRFMEEGIELNEEDFTNVDWGSLAEIWRPLDSILSNNRQT